MTEWNHEPEYNLEQGSRLIAAMCKRNPEFAFECAEAEASVRKLNPPELTPHPAPTNLNRT
jgi:hypothetical protein